MLVLQLSSAVLQKYAFTVRICVDMLVLRTIFLHLVRVFRFELSSLQLSHNDLSHTRRVRKEESCVPYMPSRPTA